MQSLFTSLPDHRQIHTLTDGDPKNPPIVLVHGGGVDSALISWRHVIPVLATHYSVYAPDLPGYGQSDAPPANTPYTTDFLIDTLSQLLDVWNLETVILVGLSMGGATILGYTLQHRERVHELILVDSYGFQDVAPWQPFSSISLSLPDALVRIVWRLMQQHDVVRWMGLAVIFHSPLRLTQEILDDARESVHVDIFYRWLRTEVHWTGCHTNYYDQLPDLMTKTLIVHGKHDPSIPLMWAKRANAALPNGELVVIPNCGHWSSREQPTLFNAAVMAFLMDD